MQEAAAHVFVSYSHTDRRRVDELVAALVERNVVVRWDADLRAGDSNALLDELRESAAAVLVVWSDAAARSSNVVREAAGALAAGTYVPVTLDGIAAVPPNYRDRFTVDISASAGDSQSVWFEQLVGTLEGRIRAAESAAAAETAASGPASAPAGGSAPAASASPAFDPVSVPVAQPALRPQPGTTELLRFALGVSHGEEVTPSHIVLAALVRLDRTALDRTELAGAATSALHRALPAPAEPRIEAALSAAGVDGIPSPQPLDLDDGRVQAVLESGRALARRLGATLFYSHHVVGASLTADALPSAVLAELGVTGDQLRIAFRAGIARRWPAESASVWDDVLGPVRDLAVAAETAALWGWVAAVRWIRGPGPIDDTDIVLGALAAARAGAAAGSTEALYRSIPAGDPTPERRLEAAFTAAGVSGVVNPSGDASDVPPTPTTMRAAGIAERVSSSPVVGRRHLLAAALTGDPLPVPVVAALGVDGEALRAGLAAYLARTWPQEPTEAWQAELTVDVELDSVFSPDSVTAAGPIEDRLDLGVYVGMLATLIARTSTTVPLSIGLFGEWGSGKSYFMELLRRKIDELAGRADTTPGASYHAVILQIRFNAWHYADTNLWASLASEFFGLLARDLNRDDTDPVMEQRTTLEEKLAAAHRDVAEKEKSRIAAEEKAARLRSELAEATAAREQEPVNGADLLGAVAADPEIRVQLAAVAGQLGLAGDKALEFAENLNELRGNLTATRRVLARKSVLLPFVVLVVGTAVIALALAAIRSWPASTVTAVIGLLTSASIAVGYARRLTDKLRGLVDRAQQVQQRIDENRRRAGAALAQQLHEAETAAAREREQTEQAQERIAQIKDELGKLSPDRRLSAFLTERAASAEYRAKLGVVSIVRQDFEELVKRMKEWKDEHQDGVGRKPIDRIVLYIDDLDRCEPDQVVTVLQAVHLLLAMDLFVVVVGVDPRWLLRSLSRRYRRVLGATATMDERDAGFSASTPQNYLEKIFQVPFVLPGMDPVGFAGLLTHLARPDHRQPIPIEPKPAFIPDAEPSTRDAAVPADQAPDRSADLGTSTNASVLDAETGSEVEAAQIHPPSDPAAPADPLADQVSEVQIGRPEAIITPISDDELALLARLAPLVQTPRAATRLFNVYGLLRSTRNLTEGGRFLDRPDRPGDYQAVAQLLGILMAAPQLLGPLLWGRQSEGSPAVRGLCRPNPTPSWKVFVATLTPELTGATWHNSVTDALSPDEVPAWRQLSACLLDIGKYVELDDIERYRLWAPKIARFSFLMSPFTADEPDAAAVSTGA